MVKDKGRPAFKTGFAITAVTVGLTRLAGFARVGLVALRTLGFTLLVEKKEVGLALETGLVIALFTVGSTGETGLVFGEVVVRTLVYTSIVE